MLPTFENILCPSKPVLTDVEPANNEIEHHTKITGHTKQYDHKTHVQCQRTFSNYPWGTLSMQKMLVLHLATECATKSPKSHIWNYKWCWDLLHNPAFTRKNNSKPILREATGLDNDSETMDMFSFHLLFCDCDTWRVDKSWWTINLQNK